MDKIFYAFRRSFAALVNTKVLFLLLMPPLIAVGGLAILFFIFWTGWTTGLGAWFSSLWILQWAQSWPDLGYWMAVVFLLLVFIPLSYLLSVLLTSIFVMPLVLIWVGNRDFGTLEKKRGGTIAGSIWNALFSAALFVFYFLISLPLWLIPGGQILVPLFLTSWLNKRVFMYDVLQDYASQDERKRLLNSESKGLYALGMLLGLMNYIPLAFFFVPVLSALSYTYYGLESLKKMRAP